MCGIAGIIRWDGPARVRSTRSARMCRAMVHRGPDEEGIYLGDGVGLGMRRLSIIDLDSGQQPVSNEDGSVWVVFNGEIYNYRELRRELEQRGHTFRTDERHRDHRAPLRGARAAAASSACAACSRSRSGTAGAASCCWPAIGWASSRSTTPSATASSSFASELKPILQLPDVDRVAELGGGRPPVHVPRHARRRRASSTASQKLEPARLAIATPRHAAAHRALLGRRRSSPTRRPPRTSWSSSCASCSPSRSRCTRSATCRSARS